MFTVVDAAGKPPADILGGGLIWLGDYDECLSIQAAAISINKTSYSISGQYCIASLPLKIPPTMFSPVSTQGIMASLTLQEIQPTMLSPVSTQGLYSQSAVKTNSTSHVFFVSTVTSISMFKRCYCIL